MRILIVRLGAFGDVVHVLPALDALRRSFPTARIDWAIDDRWAALLQGHPQIDELLVFPRSGQGLWPARGAFLARLRGRRYDAVLDFHGNLRSGLVTALARTGQRLGYARGYTREPSWLVYHRRWAPAGLTHKVDQHLSLARQLGARTEGARPVLPVFPGAVAEAEAYLARAWGSGPGMVVVQPVVSAYGAIKQWPLGRFAEVIRALMDRGDVRVLISRGPGDGPGLAELGRHLGPDYPLPERAPSLQALVELLRRADALVGCDSGPLHLAAALGLPCAGIYGPKDPARYGPRYAPVRVLHHPVHCFPCTLKHCPDRICLDRVRVREVLEAVTELAILRTPLPRTVESA